MSLQAQFFLFILLYLSGCVESSKSKEVKTIEIDGMLEVITIDNSQQPIKLVVTGMECLVTVTKNTNLVEVVIDGPDNIVRVSSSHNFNSSINGLNSYIDYYD